MQGTQVLISIKPQWCKLIAEGKKTLEFRHNIPNLNLPFRCLIYCTRGSLEYTVHDKTVSLPEGKRVIGEFTCTSWYYIVAPEADQPQNIFVLMQDGHKLEDGCVPMPDLIQYIGHGKAGYAWGISDLKLYEQPKTLEETGICKHPPMSWRYIHE